MLTNFQGLLKYLATSFADVTLEFQFPLATASKPLFFLAYQQFVGTPRVSSAKKKVKKTPPKPQAQENIGH